MGALAAAIEGEVGADAIVCEAAQGSAENKDNANSRFRFNELFITSPREWNMERGLR